MMGRSNVDRLGTEKVGKLLWEMSSQTTLSLLIYAIYSITDAYFLSVGINSLAAAGASIISPVLIALGGIATTVGAGGASVVSRALGENDAEKASKAVANAFLVFWAVAVLVTLLGTVFIRPIVFLFGATESIAPYAVTYGRIIFLGAITSTGFSAIVRADGNARYSMAMWLIPVGVNIMLSWLFIMVLKLGVAGAALATVSGQAISAGMSIYFFFFKKGRSYQLRPAYFRPDWTTIGEIVAVGFPSFLKNISTGVVVIVTNNLLRAMGGDNALGVFAIVSRLYSGLNTPQVGIMQGAQPIVGYNFGRKKHDRVRKTVIYSLASSVLYGVVVCGVCQFFPTAVIGLLSKESAIIAEGRTALRLLSLAYPLAGALSAVLASVLIGYLALHIAMGSYRSIE